MVSYHQPELQVKNKKIESNIFDKIIYYNIMYL